MEQKVKELALLGKSPMEIALILGIPLIQMNQYHKVLQEAFLLRAELPPGSGMTKEKKKRKPRKKKLLTPEQIEERKEKKRKYLSAYKKAKRLEIKKDPVAYQALLKKERERKNSYRRRMKENDPEKYEAFLEEKRIYGKEYRKKNAARLNAKSAEYLRKLHALRYTDPEKYQEYLEKKRAQYKRYRETHPDLYQRRKERREARRREQLRKANEYVAMQKALKEGVING